MMLSIILPINLSATKILFVAVVGRLEGESHLVCHLEAWFGSCCLNLMCLNLIILREKSHILVEI